MNEFFPNQNNYFPNYSNYIPQQMIPQQMPQRSIPMQQSISLPGKVVESFDVFKTIDIPFDGNVYYFPKADGSELYTKRWLNNGTTEQLVYKLVKEEPDSDKPNPIMEMLTSIDERIGKLEKVIVRPTVKNKKEDMNE